jgi:hypothetical protein
MIPAVYGLPGLRTAVTATHRIVFKGGRWDYVSLPGGATIDASESRDRALCPVDPGSHFRGLHFRRNVPYRVRCRGHRD